MILFILFYYGILRFMVKKGGTKERDLLFLTPPKTFTLSSLCSLYNNERTCSALLTNVEIREQTSSISLNKSIKTNNIKQAF